MVHGDDTIWLLVGLSCQSDPESDTRAGGREVVSNQLWCKCTLKRRSAASHNKIIPTIFYASIFTYRVPFVPEL